VCTGLQSGNTCNHPLSSNQAEITIWNYVISNYNDSNVSVIVY
jgi:hypothetical protein